MDLPTNCAAIAGAIDPQSVAPGTVTTGWVSLVTYHSALAVVQAGTLGALATVDAKLQQATSAAGAGAKDISGKSITQLTKAGSDDNKQVVVNLRASELDVTNGFTHARLSITVGTAASEVAGLLFGFEPRWSPPTPATTVAQTVN